MDQQVDFVFPFGNCSPPRYRQNGSPRVRNPVDKEEGFSTTTTAVPLVRTSQGKGCGFNLFADPVRNGKTTGSTESKKKDDGPQDVTAFTGNFDRFRPHTQTRARTHNTTLSIIRTIGKCVLRGGLAAI